MTQPGLELCAFVLLMDSGVPKGGIQHSGLWKGRAVTLLEFQDNLGTHLLGVPEAGGPGKHCL